MTHPTVTQALLPCPFCGGEKILVSQTIDQAAPNWYATCHRTTCAFTGYSSTKAEAITAWNTRATEASTAARIAALEGALADLCASMEYWAGCDEGVSADFASAEIMSAGGAWPSVSYDKARAALTATEGEG